jgi:hypothetical protein
MRTMPRPVMAEATRLRMAAWRFQLGVLDMIRI